MKQISFLLVFSMALIVAPSFAQGNAQSIEDQFTDVIEKSNRYQDYKVVKIFKLNALKKNVRDTIAAIEENLITANSTIGNQQKTIDSLQTNASSLKTDLSSSQAKEDGISLFGSLISKATYKFTMWAIIGVLALILFFFMYKFKNSNAVTKEANLRLAETESELEDHRQKNLEQQQQLRRKLQDEINKNKKV